MYAASLLASGCATSVPGMNGEGLSWKLPGWGVKPTETRAEIAEKSAAMADSSTENPFRREQPLETQLASASQPGASGEAKSTASPGPRFDAATMMLIETEFKDASVEERKQWFEELRQVPPEMVPRILRMRRLTQQAIQSRETPRGDAPQGQGLQSSSNLVATTSSTANSADAPASSANPLQALNPWEAPPSTTAALPQPPENAVPPVMPTGGVQQTSAWASPPAGVNQAATLPNPVAGQTAGAQAPDETAAAPPPESFEKALEHLIALREQQVATLQPGELEEDRLRYTSQHATLRMLYLMADRQERALEAIPQLPTSEQEFWQQMFWGLSNYFDSTGIPNPADRATHAVSQFSEATGRLRERANLELRNLAFCKRIDGFGIYERFDRDEFRPGEPVLVYAEMRNFLSEPTSDGRYKTILKSTIEIHRAGSQSGLVTRQDFTPTEDLCRNRRSDYFHSYMINIPDRVTVGPHILKLIVEDQLNRKVASYTVNFTVN